MKLIIQIPCYDEEASLPETLAALPKTIPGIKKVETLVVDDGSTDNTVNIAEKHGVDHIIKVGYNKGLANAFMTGLHECLRLGADIIVNTDADNQYNADDIPKLVAPIVEGKADYVVGERPIGMINHFSPGKKFLQKLGSGTVRFLSGIDVPDAPSGFRALSRETAYKLNVFNRYTYTLETLIQAGHSNIKTISVPIRVNGETRPSRLFKSMYGYVIKSTSTILRFFLIYRAFPLLLVIASLLFGAGFLLGVRFLYLNFVLGSTGHIQSVILSGVLMTVGFIVGTTALLADLISINRKLLENIKYQLYKLHYDRDE